jgi:hypothetical protein
LHYVDVQNAQNNCNIHIKCQANILTYQLHDLEGNLLSQKKLELFDLTGGTPISLPPIKVTPMYDLSSFDGAAWQW